METHSSTETRASKRTPVALTIPLLVCFGFSLLFLAAAIRSLFLEERAVYVVPLTGLCLALLWGVGTLVVRYLWARPPEVSVRVTKIAFLVVLVMHLCVVKGMQVVSMLDLSWVIRQCEAIIDTGDATFSLREYFGMYPNNAPLCAIVYWCLRLARLVGVHNISIVGGLLNVIMLQIAYRAFFATLRLYVDDRTASCVTLLLLCNPLYHVHASYYYTDTVCLGPLMLGVYLAGRCLRDKPGKRTILFAAGSGTTFALATCIRSTCIFLPAALLVVAILRKRWDALKYVVAPFMLCGALVMAGNSALVAYHVPYDTTDTAFPATHWLMLGANGDTWGQYSRDDVYLSMGMGGHDEKVRGEMEEFRNRWSSRTFLENLNFIAHKEVHVWSRWDKEYHKTTVDVRNRGVVWELIHGRLSTPLHIYMRAYNVMLLALIALGIGRSLRVVPDGMDTLCVYWVFAIAFYVFWESHCRHSLSLYVPLTMLATPVLIPSKQGYEKSHSDAC